MKIFQLPQRLPALSNWLKLFYLLSWLHMLWLTSAYMELGVSHLALTPGTLFHVSAWLLYSALYTSPLLLLGWPLARLAKTAKTAALLASVLCLLLVLVDSLIYSLYRFHINGFVLNLVLTPGGISSLGGDTSTYVSAALLVGRVVAIQAVLLAISLWLAASKPSHSPKLRHGALAALVLFLVQGSVYGISDIQKNGAVLDSATVYPFFQVVRFRSLARHFGYSAQARTDLSAEVDTTRLNYPHATVTFAPVPRPPNIVLLVVESLRWDQLTPEIMPNSWAFARKADHFSRHYSSGNGTREALFGMFYGLYGSYWQNFLTAQRSPLLMDRIQQLGYQLDIRTSARFTYPELDKTLFANVPVASLQETDQNLAPWQRDQLNTGELVEFLDQRKTDKPFFSFFFLESTHAGYSFPADSAIRTPYLPELDYANISLEELGAHRSELINRYSNAAHWVDRQLGRIYRTLEHQNLLENTIVIVTGDHGEEFLEHGAWGHNSSFVRQQTQVPLVISMPGQPAAAIDRLTSHMDIATTLLQVLGAENDQRDYSQGRNIFDGSPRPYITLGDWHSIAVLTDTLKYRIPYLNGGINWSPTDSGDNPLAADVAARAVAQNRDLIIDAMANCTLFSHLPKASVHIASNP